MSTQATLVWGGSVGSTSPLHTCLVPGRGWMQDPPEEPANPGAGFLVYFCAGVEGGSFLH